MTSVLKQPVQRPAPSVLEPKRPAPTVNTVAASIVGVLLVVGGIWSVISIGIEPAVIARSFDNAVAFARRMFPLDFPPLGETLSLIAETLAIVFLSTLLAVILSIPVALTSATPTTSGRGAQATGRALTVLARAIPDLVLAIVFLRMFGLGAAAGILAMGIHSVGMVAKLYADAIEELDDGPRESIESAGGTRRQQIWAAIPQLLMPQIIATALHRFDINLRTSVLLGYVGVGGIGLAISESLRVLDYQRGMALALIVLALCIVIEMISGAIRAAILNRAGGSVTGGTWADKVLNRNREPGAADVHLTPPWTSERVSRFVSAGVLAALTLWALLRVDINWPDLTTRIVNLPATLSLFFPPSSGGAMDEMLEQLLITVQIALAATMIGAVLALPIGCLAARNVMRKRAVHGFFRTLIAVIRGIPELILAIIFVVISGLGAVAGTLALAIGAVGLLSKLIADSLEETDTGVQEALRTTGASDIQVFFSATVRQAAPAFVAHTLYLLDTNIRSATLLGVVGAGGVGFLLLNAARINAFDVVTMILILMVAVVLVVEGLSMWLRKTIR
ncbi:phosphonate ABC transporter, permease protein PhnE [Corynebacterium liangguodongii]|uniref:Phosphonate ABC transporter, permease protein PhnE n=1 Tax=Corynebacterium liangguodongii TaxID=2079535 RepID=A0A2S0WFI6_9CORY|nr:phosphonate ABC transporter, permease protein PhnE [Corynebacterium liangguodongii]AWB84484.1 phosphonate ABC transporter, permease protein PhnE [Corynebacterium liangguodongii]PWB98702.1 phosphonate ABC transporter, permease protein PhnE [Corynebacterium liangguodongii]